MGRLLAATWGSAVTRVRSAATPVFAEPSSEAAWRPSDDILNESRAARFVERIAKGSLELAQGRAARDPEWFWSMAAEDLGLPWTRSPEKALDRRRGAPFAKWWPGGQLNVADAVTSAAVADPGSVAVLWEGEDGEVRSITWDSLEAELTAATAAFSELGIGRGSRVGVYLPMTIDAVVVLFALARAEAIAMPIFSGFGAAAVADRLRAFGATYLLTADTYLRRGRSIPMKETADAAVAEDATIKTVVVIRRSRPVTVPWQAGRDVWWHEVLAQARSTSVGGVAETATDAETPLMVLYTSGTTGRPKGTVHTHGGFAAKVAADLAHTFDLRPRDTLLWLSDLGWLMGPLVIVGAALLMARLVLFEGAVDYPGPDRLWGLVARHGISHLGLSPTAVRALRVYGTEPAVSHDVRSLRVFGSTGEPWDPESWRWLFETVGRSRVPIVNYSGGTEVDGGILGCTLLRPIRPASFNGPCLGMAADVVDETGRSARGRLGELVIRQPWPGMTRGFWDEDPERYLDAYWRTIKGLWRHGDLALLDAHGYWYVHGRSDDTLNIAGKRVGPSEIESAAALHAAVIESAAIGVPHEIKGVVAVVVAVLRPGHVADLDLSRSIADQVARTLGSSFRPHLVVAVPALPHTRSGKIMRRLVRSAFLGDDWGDISAVENPEALSAISDAGRMR